MLASRIERWSIATLVALVLAAPRIAPAQVGAPPTPPLSARPAITFFGVTRADYTLVSSSASTADGLPIYERPADSGFALVVEGRPGTASITLGTSSFEQDVSQLPDLQVEVSRALGDGSTAVCDDTGPHVGGVPAMNPFDFSPAAAAVINDLSCRFKDGQGHPLGRTATEACTYFLPDAQYQFVDASSTIQFCGLVDTPLGFPPGDTTVAVRLRDVAGNASAVAQIVIRVPNETPAPTETPTPTATGRTSSTAAATRTAATPNPTATPSATATVNTTPTATFGVEPAITFFGVTRADYTLVSPVGMTTDGIPIYQRGADSGFALVIEGRPGNDGIPLSGSSFDQDSTRLPDLQVEVSRPLGNGSTAVCDDTGPHAGGVPAVDPFDFSPAAAAAINDLSCRFRDGQGHPLGRTADEACTYFLPEAQYRFVDANSTLQFCGLVDTPIAFPPGDTLVAARVRDVDGTISALAQIVIRVPDQTPTITATAPPTAAAKQTAAAVAASGGDGSTGDGCTMAPAAHAQSSSLISAGLPILLIRGLRRRWKGTSK